MENARSLDDRASDISRSDLIRPFSPLRLSESPLSRAGCRRIVAWTSSRRPALLRALRSRSRSSPNAFSKEETLGARERVASGEIKVERIVGREASNNGITVFAFAPFAPFRKRRTHEARSRGKALRTSGRGKSRLCTLVYTLRNAWRIMSLSP